jgi:hypothetical protein
MKKVTGQPGKWLFLNRISFIKKGINYYLVVYALLFPFFGFTQIANYVSNGSFENNYSCVSFNSINVAKNWRSIDSSIFSGVLYCSSCYSNIPSNSYGYQWPRTGQSNVITDFLCQPPQCSSTSNRGYYRNRLKANLISGKTYCVKFYVNIGNNSTYGIDAFGAYFGDNSLDTITKISIPLTYLNPQVQNPIGNIITDTLNWIAITGTFVANGTEKNCVIGNFKSDANTNKILINPTFLPKIATTVLVDDASCIPLDLPAYAGPDIWGIPGNTVYIGRPQDVGIDEACQWFQLPNTTSVISTSAGLTLTVTIPTCTYMVKQDICGVIKYDTVVVYASGVGLLSSSAVENNVRLFPNPAQDLLSIELDFNNSQSFNLRLYNNLGQLIREEELVFKNKTATVNTKELTNGIYFVNLVNEKGEKSVKKLVIAK